MRQNTGSFLRFPDPIWGGDGGEENGGHGKGGKGRKKEGERTEGDGNDRTP